MSRIKKLIKKLKRKKPLVAKGAFKYNWIEESLSVTESIKNQRPLPKSKEFLGTSLTSGHLRFLRVAVIILVGIVSIKTFYLQGMEGTRYFAMAEQNRIRIRPIPSKRGIIYDKHNTPLVANSTSFSLVLIPNDLPRNSEDRDRIIQAASDLANIEKNKIYKLLDEYKKYSYEAISIQEGIPYETALAFKVASSELPGIRVDSGTQRQYYNLHGEVTTSTPHSLSHILGYVGKLSPDELEAKYELGYYPTDIIGKTGIESSYEDFIRGHYGKKKIEVDASGRERLVLAEDPPVPGRHIVLGIDKQLQKHLEETMQKMFETNKNSRGSAIALDPETGLIRALVSLPAYDNNDFIGGISVEKYANLSQDPDMPLFNRSISGTYPSGSTIKPMVAAAALEEGIITKTTTFLSAGGLQISLWFFPDWKAGGHGLTNVVKALAESVNTFFFIIGGGYKDIDGMGVGTITKYLRDFGFAKKLGIDIPAEASGFLPSAEWKNEVKQEQWYIGDTYNLSIGQGDVLVTPLQIAAATAVIANGGTLYRPHLVERVIDPTTNEVQPIEPQTISSIPIKKEHLKTIQQGMRACAEWGSCKSMSTLSFTSAGKTGTAQWSSTKEPHAWFTGFAPYINPQIVITVIIEDGEEGGRVALPVAKEFLRYWAELEGV